MYVKARLVDTVRIPPELLHQNTEENIKAELRTELEGVVDKKLGMIVSILDVIDIGEGRIIPGDGGVYYETSFDAILFRPLIHEIIEGRTIEIVSFGAFVSIGPMDALLHISQIADDYFSYDEKNARIVGEESKLSLSEGDSIRARIVSVSLSESGFGKSKIGLTMRQPCLGKIE